MEMRRTWDQLAAAGDSVYVGDPATGAAELASLLGRLGADPRGGTCVEVGCGPGRMTGSLAVRFDRVIALDISAAMIERAHSNVHVANVEFRLVSGAGLDGVPDRSADALVCYLVLQHLPEHAAVRRYLHEFARVLSPSGEAFVQVPVLGEDLRSRAWRTARSLAVPLLERLTRSPVHARAFRGFRLTRTELDETLAAARLVVVSRDEGPSAYRHCTDLFLRLRRR